jgi:hypothetical protein
MLARRDSGSDLVVTIRVGADGKVYFHDIPPAMLPVALALAPGDASLVSRAAALAKLNLDTADAKLDSESGSRSAT